MISLDQFSSFLHLKRVTAWIRRFVDNCRRKDRDRPTSLYLSTSELMSSETYWLLFTQRQAFATEITIKAVHLELVSDLSFIAALRRFISRRGKPSLIWSDHGTNFIGAVRELKEFITFFQNQQTQGVISEFCSMQNITWSFIPERTPHFGGLWEAAVKSMKRYLKRVIGETKPTFEEFATVLTEVEACLNSRPLAPLPCEGDTVEPLTPGHFLIGRPLEAHSSASYRSISLLRRWHLCQHLIRHFWKRWATEYIDIIRRFTKWHSS